MISIASLAHSPPPISPGMGMMHCSLLSLGCIFAVAPAVDALPMTAFRAFKVSKRRLKAGVRSQLLSLSSSRSDASLVPTAWRFVFQDPSTAHNTRTVTVAAEASSEHPDTVRAFASSIAEDLTLLRSIPQDDLLVDSHQALDCVRSGGKLTGVRSVEYRLVLLRRASEPLWTLQFFAEGGEAISQVRVGAMTGRIE